MLFSLLQLAFAGSAFAAANARGLNFPRMPGLHGVSAAEAATIDWDEYPAQTIQIPVDHFNPSDNRTYANRFWVNSDYYRPGGPIFMLDPGEQNGLFLVPHYLHETVGPSSPMTLARRFNGLAVLFEHRYYGGTYNPEVVNGSYPVPVNASGMATEYTYLNNEQALQDAVFFANNFKPAGLDDCHDKLSPTNAPWVWIGGSYPGARAAMIRVRNPETFYASWASSAPTQAMVDMWVYYAQAETSMTRNCSADFTAVTRYADDILANGTAQEISDLKSQLYVATSSGPGWNNNAQPDRNVSDQWQGSDVGNAMLMPFDYYQDYGFEGTVQPFCDVWETFNQTNVRTTDNDGTAAPIASEGGIAITHNITAAWNAYIIALTSVGYNNIPSPGPSDLSAGYSWAWQYCSEFGFYQVGNPLDPHTIESRYISIDYFQQGCNETFQGIAGQQLPPSPQVQNINKYGGWDINPSNIMFATGQYDPWRGASPTSINRDIGAPGRTSKQVIPKCFESPDPSTVFGLEYINALHASDLRVMTNTQTPWNATTGFHAPVSNEQFFAGVGLFTSALEEWLPCFKNGSYAHMWFQLPKLGLD